MKLCAISDCKNYAMTNIDVCDTHRREAKKSERVANQPVKKKKTLPKFSKKRKEKLKEYKPLRDQYLLDHPECEVKLIGCQGSSIEIHHCSTSDKDFTNFHTWKAVCRNCHDKIEFFESAISRKESGLLISSVNLNRDVEKHII